MPNTKKRQETISTLHAQYVCTFRSEREGGYSVRCPAFPGLITNGKTLEAARANAREALELCIEVYQDKGWPLPASDAEPRGTIRELIPVKLARA
jgi:predicted RNase H-like HicB family nuclease